MKNKTFYIKVINILWIAIFLVAYQGITVTRDKEFQITQLEHELEIAKETIEGVRNSGFVVEEAESDMEAESRYQDGVYTGEANGFGGAVKVEVVIEYGKISKITILDASKEDPAYVTMAQEVIEDMLSSQTAEVDAVSGATFTSTGIINAVANALEGMVK